MHIYQDNRFYFVRKPRGLPSTLGNQESLVGSFLFPQKLQKLLEQDVDFLHILPYFTSNEWEEELVFDTFITNQKNNFSEEEEFGLVNRLDNDTGGFLYFAKTKEVALGYKQQQAAKHIKKKYLTKVTGNPFYHRNDSMMVIDTPIMHYQSTDKKMLLIRDSADRKKGRGVVLQATTVVHFLSYNEVENTSLLEVIITKGVRHQIRVHLAGIGAPIVGDFVYNSKAKYEDLQLWSIGMEVVCDK